jgi:hypothetical protein
MKFENLIERILVVAGLALLTLGIVRLTIDESSKRNKITLTKTDTVRTFEKLPEIIEVSGTVYNPVADQCDGSPLYTADGSYIDTALLKAGKLHWLAISQDLLVQNGGPYNLGDTIFVYHPDDKIRGKWIIHDCMNPRAKRYLDFLQPVGGVTIIGNIKHILISKQKFYD